MTSKRIDIRQARSSITCADGQTLLEAALTSGISYPHGCKSGRCGSCKTRLIEGNVEILQHSRFALSDEEKADGLILACRSVPLTDITVAWLGAEHEELQPAQRLRGIITRIEDLTHDIKLVQVTPENGLPLNFEAGQYAELSFNGVPSRSYSMANRSGESYLEFHIRHVPGGNTSGYVHQTLKTGDPIKMEVALGASFLRQYHSDPILCIAGGSGLAPIKSIVETALAHGMKQRIHVYFGARSERDLYLTEHFRSLTEKHPNLSFTPVLSEARSELYRSGFVTRAVAEDIADFSGWKAYVAGPPLMVDAAMAVTFARGLQKEDMYADIFFTPETLPIAAVAE
ncbi:2Fe-2S iron-sulfur cluster binding domain-containing protein [Bacillus subtilis]|uniref:2Fe-2S iron-sulfur cluster-binding protein n=1 Tax=Pseudochrobactrum asaccharolyticum TaxID=354351 RepID=UPI001EFFC64A|nr:2Fe-2S iron-sulfur cluster-binding protein [Pseudochrobactrum asaccharolyticum]MCF7646394.1 2Fe-2S iron-sulfur cluster binding domain-containing protein [Pseudochrobactrum asaccharolyticum]MCF7673228.1 2Fe-2S iron-sulfur cluster binding domain-containing protein [Bacillus subtilis]